MTQSIPGQAMSQCFVSSDGYSPRTYPPGTLEVSDLKMSQVTVFPRTTPPEILYSWDSLTWECYITEFGLPSFASPVSAVSWNRDSWDSSVLGIRDGIIGAAVSIDPSGYQTKKVFSAK